ncbi:hypothetical protein GCM10023318_55090 [Nocardia callitridis]|uniref:Uncharacterized protein n=1 Tax=Nocardia callitridis TaxID=648753 RepID=A0ABP9KYW7_9NOCA
MCALETLTLATSSGIHSVILDEAAVGVFRAGAMLVRPDNDIAWRTAESAGAALLADIIAAVTVVPASALR